MAGRQQTLIGTVVSDKMAKTVVVLVEHTTRHRLYRKILKRSKRYLAHDDRLGAKPGDRVRILQSRPLSARKRWRVIEIIKRGEVAEVAPSEIDQAYLAPVREREAPPPPTPKTEAAEETQAVEAEAQAAVDVEEAAEQVDVAEKTDAVESNEAGAEEDREAS